MAKGTWTLKRNRAKLGNECKSETTTNRIYTPLVGMATAAPEWLQLWDSTHHWHYYYSTITGESTWEAPSAFVPYQPANDDSIPLLESTEPRVHPPEAAPVPATPQLKHNQLSSTESVPVTAPFPWMASDRAICLYTFQFKAHTMCCEAPALFLECFFKSAWYLLLTLLLVIGKYGFDRRRWGHVTISIAIREAIVYAASALSCALPPLLLSMYRRFSPATEEWTLAPLTTVIGGVDPRRFRVVLCGNGSWAVPPSAADAQDISEYSYPMDRFWGPFACLGAREVESYCDCDDSDCCELSETVCVFAGGAPSSV